MTDLGELLSRERDRLVGFLRQRGSGLLRYESLDDLVQGVHLRALQGGAAFEYRGPEEFRAWLFAVAKRHIADRHDHWMAQKRGAGRVLRLTLGGSDPGAVPQPAAGATGPGTFASRREMLTVITRAIDALPPRDRELVRWASEGLSIAEQAEHLGIEPGAAQRAGHRAFDRLRKTLRLLQARRE